jgi:hypothetical protein
VFIELFSPYKSVSNEKITSSALLIFTMMNNFSLKSSPDIHNQFVHPQALKTATVTYGRVVVVGRL